MRTMSDNETGSDTISGLQFPAAMAEMWLSGRALNLPYIEAMGLVPPAGGECLPLVLIVYLFV